MRSRNLREISENFVRSRYFRSALVAKGSLFARCGRVRCSGLPGDYRIVAPHSVFYYESEFGRTLNEAEAKGESDPHSTPESECSGADAARALPGVPV